MKYLPVIFALLLAGAVFAAESPAFTVSTLSSPASVEPGASFSLQIQIQNSGKGAANDMEVYPVIEGPFEVKAGTKTKESISTLNAGQIAVVSFDFFTIYGTNTGIYNLKIAVLDGSGLKVEKAIPISVQSSPDIEVVDVISPEKISPGDLIELKLVLKNVGGGEAKNVRVTYAESTALLPVGAAVGFVDSISPGIQKTVRLPLSIAGDTEGGSKTLAVTINFDDSSGAAQTAVLRNIGVKVSSNIELKAFLDEQTSMTAGVTGAVSVQIANTGPNIAQYLEVKVSSDDFVLSPTSFYIGNLESDDYDTVDFAATTSKPAGDYPVTVTLSYKDQFNKATEDVQTVSVKVLSPSEYKKQQPKSRGWVILLLLVLGGAGYWYYKKKRKAKK
ncbi:MAG: CARDB domain-containing protein [archaeon]